MANKIGRFEVLSEIHQSDRVTIYKASDPEAESAKTIILKTLRLEPFGEQAPLLVENLLQEAQTGKLLKSQNIGVLHDASEIDGVFCAQMEYVEGNSIATMLERKEGFSIWDIMDITRQACQGLDHAHSKELAHYTLEPAKIMVAWDGTVKVLSFGISTMSAWAAQAAGTPPQVLYYMSPEQLAGDPVNARSNIFSMGAMLYEMATERKPFSGDDAASVRQAIQELSPVAPDQVNRKIHPVLSQVIMKALAKNPEERFASGQELVKELDRCRENATMNAAKTAPAPVKKAGSSAPSAGIVQAEKFAGRGADPAVAAPGAKSAARPAAKPAPPVLPPVEETPQVHPAAKAAAASAAGSLPVAGDEIVEWQSTPSPSISSPATEAPELMSAFVAEEPAVQPPKIAVDPLMAGGSQSGETKTVSFSEIDELPPLKEVRIAPPPPPPPPPAPDPVIQKMVSKKAEPEKSKIQVRAVAKEALKEVRKTPPQLFVYSISAALAVILVIVAAMAYHFRSENSADDNPPAPTAEATAPAQETVAPAAPAPPVQAAPEPPPQAVVPPPEPQPEEVVVSEKPKSVVKKKPKAPVRVVAPAVVPGRINITSTPAGAQVQIDGHSEPAWLTPYDAAGLQPGQHTVTISKPGFSTDSRTLEIASGSKSFLSVQLTPLTATVSINTDPAGAEVWMDGKDMGKVTPAQFSVDKAGTHSFILKKQNYLDETASASLQIGQTSYLSPSLRALGNTDDIKLGGGKFRRLLGGGGDTAGMGSVAVKTQPKGAQVAVNNRVLDKTSPLEFYLNPGNYIVDITLSGFKPVHRVVTVEKSGKVVIEEPLDRE